VRLSPWDPVWLKFEVVEVVVVAGVVVAGAVVAEAVVAVAVVAVAFEAVLVMNETNECLPLPSVAA